jgi:hypothetical protein
MIRLFFGVLKVSSLAWLEVLEMDVSGKDGLLRESINLGSKNLTPVKEKRPQPVDWPLSFSDTQFVLLLKNIS